jgi:8-oxo-dGTP diphosphatase
MKLMNFCMITKGKQVLVQDKKVVQGWEGLTFPGGKTEAFESFTDAVVREVQEETGYTVEAREIEDYFEILAERKG